MFSQKQSISHQVTKKPRIESINPVGSLCALEPLWRFLAFCESINVEPKIKSNLLGKKEKANA